LLKQKKRNTPLNPLLIEGKVFDHLGFTEENGTRLRAENTLKKNSHEKKQCV